MKINKDKDEEDDDDDDDDNENTQNTSLHVPVDCNFSVWQIVLYVI